VSNLSTCVLVLVNEEKIIPNFVCFQCIHVH
jgi:hypothetical protein